MQLTRELLLAYPGPHRLDGICHLRVYEEPAHVPVVIAGALDDNPGSSPTNAITLLATAVQNRQFPTGAASGSSSTTPGRSTDAGFPRTRSCSSNDARCVRGRLSATTVPVR